MRSRLYLFQKMCSITDEVLEQWEARVTEQEMEAVMIALEAVNRGSGSPYYDCIEIVD